MENKIYKISCEYYVRANDEKDVLEFIALEGGDFIERHISIEESSCDEEDIFEDLTKFTGEEK